MQPDLVLSVSDFVAVFNQTLEFAYPSVVVEGELSNFRVSKNRWVYFDLKDEMSSVKFFGTVYSLPGPLEDGMMLQVRGVPRLHNLYGFSINVQTMQPIGEGTLKRAAALLEAKLSAEGLFDPQRKRSLPYPPTTIGLITSGESAAYHDFIKVVNKRWGGMNIRLADVQVQGDAAPAQLVAAIDYFNTHDDAVDVIVMTRGGGSADDLAAFSMESVTRAVAGSRIPTLVAIGHEVDVSLAELAADLRASTPSNAAELLVPDRQQLLDNLKEYKHELLRLSQLQAADAKADLTQNASWSHDTVRHMLARQKEDLRLRNQVLEAFNPDAALRRGYAIVRSQNEIIKSGKSVKPGDSVSIQLSDADVQAKVEKIELQ